MNFFNNKIKLEKFKLLKSIQKYCFVFLPFFLITGPFLSDLSIVIIGLIYILIYFHEKLYLTDKNKTIMLMFLFYWVFLIFSSLMSENIYLSLESSLFYFRFIFFVLGGLYVLKHNEDALKIFSIILLGVYLIELIHGYYQFFLDREYYYGKRLSILLGDELILGSFLSRLFPLMFVLSLLLFKKNKIFLIFLSIIIILTDTLVYISGERTAFFYLLIGVTLLILMSKEFKLLRLGTFFISIIIIAYISLNDEYVKDRMIKQTINDIFNADQTISSNLNLNENTITNSNKEIQNKNMNLLFNKFHFFSPAHTELYSSSIHILSDNNYFYGVGPKLFRFHCKNKKYLDFNGPNSCSTHPHNTYIQLITEVGLMGFVPIILLFIYITFIVIKHIINILFKNNEILNNIEVGAYICIFITLWPIAPTGSFFNNWLNIIYYLPLIFLLYEKQKK